MDLRTLFRTQWDRVAAWVAIGLGALLLFLGWLGVSDTVYPAEQLPYVISGGLVGIVLIGLGAILWLSADLRDEWTELHEIARLLAEGAASDAAAADDAAPAAANREPTSGNGCSPNETAGPAVARHR